MKVSGIVSCKKGVRIWFKSDNQNGIHSGLGDCC
jgi:hypothetical protein